MAHRSLDEIISGSSIGDHFALPGALCGPFFGGILTDSHALRTILALIWLSSQTMRDGVVAQYEVAAADVLTLAGLSSYQKVSMIDEIIVRLSNASCQFPDGEVIPVFDRIEASGAPRRRVVGWVFSPEFVDMFIAPASFALINVRHVGSLKSAIDFLVFVQLMLVFRRKHKVARIPQQDIALVCGYDRKRVRMIPDRVRDSVNRVSSLLGFGITYEKKRSPFSEMGDFFEFSIQ